MEQGEEVKKKGGVPLDFEKLFASQDDDDDVEPPLPEVATTIVDDDVEQKQREELLKMRDRELEEAIAKFGRTLKAVGLNLPDGGVKMRANINRYQDELDRRRLRRLEKDDDGCEKITESNGPNVTSASDGVRQEASLPSSQSLFTARFSKKLDRKNTNSRTVNAFESELSVLGRCDRGKIQYKGKPMTTLSSRQSPFQCPTNQSVDGDKRVRLNYLQNGGHFSTGSPRISEGKVSSFVSKKRKPSQVMSSNNVRPRNGKTVVLVDEEEPELSESVELADEPDECIMKDSKIYYPSSDDPESIEICYSDMECLNPQAYLSSTIMNFYIRYLQRNSPTRARRDYHFFNTYFYNKLKEAVLKKNDQQSYFIKFRRWWKGVDIFHKAYILLPIHETVHWSLVIICIPDKEDESGPILLHLDSLGLHSSNLIFDKIRSFLKEEWNYLNGEEAPSDLPIADRIWKNLPRRIEGKTISVPQQKNDYDCGLFVLYFMERFIDVAPRRLKKKDLAMFSNKWFKPEEASSLRKKVRKLLLDEFRNATRQNCVSDQDPSSVGPQEERLQTIDC
ncbi:ubiquitin-like-specific protease 1D isoform X2 [Rhododendron vialii]|uniref:ubiquitin-like-specific protease 1D isoform X2 n=1 Tax=Rhododendron vialii TaxID=182163 RepID=UPI0026604F6D|nr:ubiquitin-like-specific protease 1D isoform X2 [Rhododendron vialii]